MACRRCGSGWVTYGKGLDMLSCPECCKIQRCKARKQGRLSSEVFRPCGICGKQMTVSGSAICSTRYCDDCRPQARRQRVQRCKERAKRGVPPRGKKARPSTLRDCLNCGSRLEPRQQKYCSRECFFAARNSGAQSWDRTNQLQSNVNRCGIQLCPSKQGLSRVLNGFAGFMVRLRGFQRRISRLHCLTCDSIVRRSSRFCSRECSEAFEFDTTCKQCGTDVRARGWIGRKRSLCNTCREVSKAEERKRHKRKYGSNHRKRARHYGVEYVSFPVRMVLERDGYVCQICRKKVLRKVKYRKKDGKIHPRSPTLDHIIPFSKGGPHRPDNCQCACFICNSLKGASSSGQRLLPMWADM